MKRPRKWRAGRPIRTVQALEKAAKTPGVMLWVKYGSSYDKAHHPIWVRNWNYAVVMSMLARGSICHAVLTPEYRVWYKQWSARKALREMPF